MCESPQSKLKIKIKKLHPDAVIPKKAHESDAAYDLTAVSRSFDDHGNVVYGFGFALEIPEGYVGLVFPRSSIYRKDLFLTNAVGVIDAGYRGEVTAKFKSTSQRLPTSYNVGDRVAQLIVIPIPEIEFVEADMLSDTVRGAGGYGSTGE